MKTIVLTGGGTAGHVTTNLSLIPLLKQEFDKIIYIGSDNSIEKELLKNYPEVDFYPITTTKLIRSLSPKNLLIPFKLHKGKKEAYNLLKNLNPSIIFSKGGFVSLPVVLSAHKLNIPIITHESDYSLGLANKLIKNKSTLICTTFEDTAKTLKNGIYTGSPFQKPNITTQEKNRLKQSLNLTSQKPICLVIGGSQGANSLNTLIRENLDQILSTHQIVHITGKNKLDPTIKKQDYHQVEYLTNLPTLLSICDISITRGGSNSIHEQLAYQIPMLIIPLQKNTRGDQVQNAKYFQDKGYAIALLDKDISSSQFQQSFEQLKKLSPIIKNSTKHAIPQNSLQKIYSLIIKHQKTN